VIISRTPLRASFVGGGSDLPAYYLQEPGLVISTAITKYIYVAVNRKFDDSIRISYTRTEMVDTVDEVKHDLVREALRLLEIDGGIEITSISEAPSGGTGLGSSGTYLVGVLSALHAYLGRFAGAEQLAQEACAIEIDRCGRPVGKQDQYIAAYGGIQSIQFNPDGSVFTDPIICAPEIKRAFQQRLLMLYTGVTRSAADILQEQKTRTESSEGNVERLRALVQLAGQFRQALTAGQLDPLGEILHEGWVLKRGLATDVSSSAIDTWYETARKHGAAGGKILGAGGGGFLLLYADPDRHDEIRSALSDLRPIPFAFEPQGSKIVYVEETAGR
jgi:D-glycero-alpha-D-manno-heptose-7-phosphate kinase